MPIDPYDAWDDPQSWPMPGAYDYRNDPGTDEYDNTFNPASAARVAGTARVYPWMSPGVAFVLGTQKATSTDIADATFRTAVADNTASPPTVQRTRQQRQKLKGAKSVVKDWALWLEDMAATSMKPQSKEDIAYLKALRVQESPDKARELASNLRARLDDDRETLRVASQLRRLGGTDDGGGIGDFLMSPVKGAFSALGLASKAVAPIYNAAEDISRVNTLDRPIDEIPGAKGVVRDVALAAQAPYELAIAGTRDFANDVATGKLFELDDGKTPGENLRDLLSQTTAYQAWINDKPTGGGLLPDFSPKIDGEQSAADAAGQAARDLYPAINIGDHAWTPGRQLADLVFDPDDAAFQTLSGLFDGSLAFIADPTNIALARLARGEKILTQSAEAVDALKAAGGMRGLRSKTNPTQARQWLLGDGYSLIKAFKSNSDAVLSKGVFPEIPISVHKQLAALPADAPDSDYYRVLAPLLGNEIRTPPNLSRIVGGRFFLGSKTKMWASLPPRFVSFDDPDEAFKAIESAGRNINAPDQVIRGIQRQIVDSAGTPAQNEAIARATMDMFREQFKAAGVNDTWANSLTRLVKDRLDDSSVYDIDENGLAAYYPFARIGARLQPLADPAFLTEMRTSAFELPDAKTARRIVSGLGEFLNGLGPEMVTGKGEGTAAFRALESSIDVLDKAQGVWKQLVLMRPAWGLRVIAEEQLRIAASGHYSLFRSPLSAVAWILGNPDNTFTAGKFQKLAIMGGAAAGAVAGIADDGDLGDALMGATVGAAGGYAIGRTTGFRAEAIQKTLKESVGRGATGLGGKSFLGDPTDYDEYAESLYGGLRNLLPSQGEKIHTNIYGTVYRQHASAPQAYAEELHRVASDPVARAILNTGDLRAVKDAFWNGDLSKYRGWLSSAPNREAATRQWSEIGSDRLLADQYIDYVAGRIERVTNNNPTFYEAMRSGRFNDQPLVHKIHDGVFRPNETLASDREWVALVNNSAPPKIRAERTLTMNGAEKAKSLGRARKMIDTLFDTLMPRPSNYLSRSSHFRQAYWQRVEELFPDMTTAARRAALKDARTANLDKATIARLNEMHATAGAGTTTLKHADTIAKRYGLDSTRDLLYDLSEKSQFFESTRLVFPFGEAWKEIIGRWANLIADHPQYVRRAQQAMTAARQMKVDPTTGLPDPGGIGLFHKDIQTGEESFIYPFTGLITDKLLGVPIPLKGSVQGLNLIGTGLPGIGPVAQFPLAAILPDTPDYDQVRNILFPYGEPTGDSPLDAFTSTVMPAWLKKVNTAFTNPNAERLQGNVIASIMQYKLSTGEYDTRGPDAAEEISRLFRDSKKAATGFMIIRGLAQASAPSAPSPEFLVKHGPNLIVASKIAEQYHKKAEKVGWDEAFEWLLDAYGPDTALLLAQPRSEPQTSGLDSSTEQLDWRRRNADLVTRYPDVWSMFAPSAGNFDIGAYNEEFNEDLRRGLTPMEMIKKANNRLASHEYHRVRDSLQSTLRPGKSFSDAQQAQLTAYRDQLVKDYPGYDPFSNQNRTPLLVSRLEDAVRDPALARTQAGKAISDYFKARSEAYAQAARFKLVSPWSSTKAKPIRDALRIYGENLVKQRPDFQVAWNEVFAYEFKD